jgi:hypothetical protein
MNVNNTQPQSNSRSDTLMVGTRKGLFTLKRKHDRWEIADVEFLGDPVTERAISEPTYGVTVRASMTIGSRWQHPLTRHDQPMPPTFRR